MYTKMYHAQFVDTFLINLHRKLNMSNSNGSLVMARKHTAVYKTLKKIFQQQLHIFTALSLHKA
jgi:hypothetical protein